MNYVYSMNLPSGHLLQNEKYRLTYAVGQGGFGITYKGIWYTEVKGPLGTVKTEVPIAVKEYFFRDYCYREEGTYAVKVHSQTGENIFHKFKEKLIKEARILSDVHHPHIVNVLEVFEENNTAYIAMEYISGLSLKQLMEKEGILPESRILKYIHQIGEALQFVHENNIIHLDIKPSNILIDRNDNARLIDFGVSKRYDDEQQETSTTMLTLSKGFASIEQYDNEGTQSFSPYPDIYSLGATMYNLLTGKIPTESILRATRPLPNPTELNPEITPRTEAVILKAMEVVPTDRFQSIQEMMEALDKPAMEHPSFALKNMQGEIQNGDDTTLLYSSGLSKDHLLSDNDDEQTILNPPEEVQANTSKKANKFFSVFVALVIMVGFIIAIVLTTHNAAEEKKAAISSTGNQDSTQRVNETIAAITDTLPTENIPEKENPVENTPTQNFIQQLESSSRQTGNDITRREEVRNPVSESLPSLVEIDKNYDDLMASGKKKFEGGDFTGAKADFDKAYETKPTREALNLSEEMNERIEEKRMNERRSQYEEQMHFGDLVIVKKIATGLYGAIDDKAIERIECKYLTADWTENGRAFERSDGKFDIYNNQGRLIEGGVTSY